MNTSRHNAETIDANPRKAATKLKNLYMNIDLIKNRYRAMQVQQQYNRYKTIDHQKRLNYHHSVHQQISKQKQILRKSVEEIHDTHLLKQKAAQVRQQIKQQISEARKSVMEMRSDMVTQRNQQFEQNQNLINQNRSKDKSIKKEKRCSIQQQQQQIKQNLMKHHLTKINNTKINKIVDTQKISNLAQQKQIQMKTLMRQEMEMIKKNSLSLQSSQIMKHKFDQVFQIHRSKLPDIRSKTNQTKISHTSDLFILG